jgi:regulator of sirC expression with transglutaminase-like and TPR domain
MKIRRLPLLIAILFTGCESSSQGELTGKLMALSDEARKEIGASVPPTGSVRDELDKIFDLAEKRVRGKSGHEIVAALNRLVFEELGFQREVQDDSIELMLLPYVVKNKRGSCLGLAALYLVIAERLDLEVRGILVPRHFFLRYRQRNIELLRQGEAMPDEWYRKTWRVPEKAAAYLRPLAEKELLAVFWFNMGNAYRVRGDHHRAKKIYQRVIGSFPEFAEAYANLGLLFQLQKDYPSAKRAYLRAQARQPDLPGLAENIQALKTNPGKDP